MLFVANVATFSLGLFLLVLYMWLVNRFDTATFDMIMIYLSLPLTGVDMRYLYSAGIQVLCVAVVTVIYALLMKRTYARETRWKFGMALVRTTAFALSVCLLLFSLGLLESKYHLYDNLFPDRNYYTYFEDNVATREAGDITFPKAKKNLVMVIVESGEWTMNDPAYFTPALMPRLRELGERHAAFTGYRQCVGTEFSVASFYSTMLGVPYLSNLSGRGVVNFMDEELVRDSVGEAGGGDFKNISMLGILENHGYRIDLFCCADAKFAAYDLFMAKAVRRPHIFDFTYFLEHDPEVTGKRNSWGLSDSYIYARAKERMTALPGDEPFVLMVQTVGTHAPGMFEEGLPRVWNDFRDSFIQADTMAADFVDWVLRQPSAENTVVVVVGDHLLGTRDVGAVTIPPEDRRSILAIFVNSVREPSDAAKRRLFATWDLPATILEALGAEVADSRFGLGTSLFSEQKNLLERDGVSKYNWMIRRRSRLYESRYYW